MGQHPGGFTATGSVKKSIVILAPRFISFYRFEADSLEVKLQLMTNRGAPASLTNLDAIIHSPLATAPLGRGFDEASPMAGYYLESFFKQRGYEATPVFKWEDSEALDRAMKSDPVAVLFSTTFITDPEVLVACLKELRGSTGSTPILVGGQYINKQTRFMRSDGDNRRTQALAEFGVDENDYLLFNDRCDPVLDDCIFIATPQGEHTAARVLERLEKGIMDREDLYDIPNLVLRSPKRGWCFSGKWQEPVDLDRHYTRWNLIDEMPAVVPIRSVLGCTEKCKFCDFRILYPRVIERSAQSIVDEIKLASSRYGSFFNFIDDNVFLTSKRAGNLCELFIKEELDMVWGGFFNADRVNEGNAQQIADSGFRYGLAGLESGDPDHMKRIGKGGDPAEMARGVEMLNSLGVNIDLTFLVGFPGETEETLDATADLINGLPTGNKGYSLFELFPFKLLPGTVADTPYFRRLYNLRGRGSDWSHDTMSYSEVIDRYAPYLFKQVDRTPYYHGNIDAPSWWDTGRRDEAFARRALIAHGFLDNLDDGIIQKRFEDLYRLMVDPQHSGSPPRWSEILADRRRQPTAKLTK